MSSHGMAFEDAFDTAMFGNAEKNIRKKIDEYKLEIKRNYERKMNVLKKKAYQQAKEDHERKMVYQAFSLFEKEHGRSPEKVGYFRLNDDMLAMVRGMCLLTYPCKHWVTYFDSKGQILSSSCRPSPNIRQEFLQSVGKVPQHFAESGDILMEDEDKLCVNPGNEEVEFDASPYEMSEELTIEYMCNAIDTYEKCDEDGVSYLTHISRLEELLE